MRVHHFSGDGDWSEKELRDDPELVERCSAVFERIWERAVPHEGYEVRYPPMPQFPMSSVPKARAALAQRL